MQAGLLACFYIFPTRSYLLPYVLKISDQLPIRGAAACRYVEESTGFASFARGYWFVIETVTRITAAFGHCGGRGALKTG
jgi:hypothetical protein